jgi:hypothetical protein
LQSGSVYPIGSEILTIQPNRRVPIVWAVELAALVMVTLSAVLQLQLQRVVSGKEAVLIAMANAIPAKLTYLALHGVGIQRREARTSVVEDTKYSVARLETGKTSSLNVTGPTGRCSVISGFQNPTD